MVGVEAARRRELGHQEIKSTRRRWVSRVLGCSLLVASPAAAAEVTARGPSECPDASELGFRLERGAGVPLAEAPATRFDVNMERTVGGYAARLAVVERAGAQSKERSLTGVDCDELADAIVVAMTLALGVDLEPAANVTAEASTARGSDAAGARQARSSGPEGAAAPEAADAGEDDEDDVARAALRPALTVAGLVDVGSLPAPGLGMALGAELSWQRLQLRALGTFLFEQHTDVDAAARPAPGADLRLLAGSLLGCSTAVGAGAFSVPLCLGFELGWFSGVGTGVAVPRSGSALWAAPRMDAGVVWCLQRSPVCFGAAVTALAPIARSRFALADIGTVHRPSAATGRLSLDLRVGFD